MNLTSVRDMPPDIVLGDISINKNPISSLKRGLRATMAVLDDAITPFIMTTIYIMVGLPASGKSTYADKLCKENPDIIIHSSDKLREELYGDENTQEHNADLFVELHRRIKRDLSAGKSVIYDATNINKKRRRAFLSELKNIKCKKVCVCIATPYELCLKYNKERNRYVPEDVIKRMYMNWCPPSFDEGFDDIRLIYSKDINKSTYKLSTLFLGDCGIDNFNQENSHHTLTLGEHCRRAYRYVSQYECSSTLKIAALLHDNGKVFTKTRINSKGVDDGDCHYYQHQCVGAYNSLFYTRELNLTIEERLYVANLIYYHMHPYLSWQQSEKALNRDRIHIGDEMYKDIEMLHNADLCAH